MASKKKVVSVSTMCRFNKSVLGYSGQSGVSVYEISSHALAQKGHHKDGLSAKQHVTKFAHVIKSHVKEHAPKTRREKYQPSYEMAKYKGPSVTTDAFLSSYEWRRLRMEAIKKHGARCQCCGATPADGIRINVDHIKPRKLFPHLALSLDNLQVLCGECNHGKGNWDMTDWRNNDQESGDAFLACLDKIKSGS